MSKEKRRVSREEAKVRDIRDDPVGVPRPEKILLRLRHLAIATRSGVYHMRRQA